MSTSRCLSPRWSQLAATWGLRRTRAKMLAKVLATNRRRAGLVLALVLAVPAPRALSDPGKPSSPSATQDSATVHELMRIEARLALHRARQRLHDVAEGDMSMPMADSSGVVPRLLAIYGVGEGLRAQVKHGDRMLVYRRGRTLPVGLTDTPGVPVFRLVSLSNTCVELDREGVGLTLCLSPSPLSGG